MTYMTYRQIISEKNAEIDRQRAEIERLNEFKAIDCRINPIKVTIADIEKK